MIITVGIPAYNEGKTIHRTINSVLKQLSKNDEVLVVASGCTDNTCEEVKKIRKSDKRIKLFIERERKGKSSAINLIIKKAKGEIIVQTDGDVILGKRAIRNLLKVFENNKIGAVSGNPIPIIPKNNLFYDWTIMSYRKIGEVRKEEVKEGAFWHLSGYLLAFRKNALSSIPFAKGAVDALMGQIIQEQGYKIGYEPLATVFVKAPLNVRDFIAQKARVRAGYYLLPKHPRSIRKEFLFLPKELLNIPLQRWPKFVLSGLIYLFSWIKGFYLAKTNKSLTEIWKTPQSTKY